MRLGYNNVKFIEDENNFYGISLGSDFCAEHEWGIDGIKRSFSINESKPGLEGKQITKDSTIFSTNAIYGVLRSVYKGFNYTQQDLERQMNNIPHMFSNDFSIPLQTAWDSDDFAIMVHGADNINKLRELSKAFAKNDIVITAIKSKLESFSNTSLSVLIKSKIPQTVIYEINYEINKKEDLVKYCDKIGMTKLLSVNREYHKPKWFMACSPRWLAYGDKEELEKRKKENNIMKIIKIKKRKDKEINIMQIKIL